MSQPDFIWALAMMTLLAGLIAAAFMLARFLKKPGNRHPMDTPAGRAADEARRHDAEAERAETHRSEL